MCAFVIVGRDFSGKHHERRNYCEGVCLGISMERDVISHTPCSVSEGKDFRQKLKIK